MPTLRACLTCGRPFKPERPRQSRCPLHQKAEDQRRWAKTVAHGRNTHAWRKLRTEALERDNYTCQKCGITANYQAMTVHLNPALRGDHRNATLEDLIVLCRRCHGALDAPRAHHTRH